MKITSMYLRLLFLLVLVCHFGFEQAWAQAPQKMSYQAVIVNAQGNPVANQNVGMRISILQGQINGTPVYVETHNRPTNPDGMVSLEVGAGSVVSGQFSSINWSTGPYFLKSETDISGGTNYSITGTSELLSVPYALYSNNGAPSGGLDGQVLTSCNGVPVWTYGGYCPGQISSIDCSNPFNYGILYQGSYALGVTSIFSYQGGNGGFLPDQVVNSTGVTGLTGYIPSTYLTNGPGTFTIYIDGVPSGPGTANFTFTISGQTCTLSRIVSAPVGGGGGGQLGCGVNPTTVAEVTNPATGKIWMDRNLGASQVASSATDVNSFGDLYQWGRGTDGHQCRNSTTTFTLSSSDLAQNGGAFILANSSPFDWRTPANSNLWQGVNGTNNPCPSGYRLPTEAELDAERLSWSNNQAAGAFSSPLKFPMSGHRYFDSGSIFYSGTYGVYWSSTISGAKSRSLHFDAGNALMNSDERAHGAAIRCIKGAPSTQGTIGTLDCAGAVTQGALTSGIAASGVSSIVSYTGGNAGSYNGQVVSSSGVTGLTATLSAGAFANGSGSLNFIITGTPANSGVASFALNIGGQGCNLNITVNASGGAPTYPSGTIHCSGTPTSVVEVINPVTGRTWMDRNLGATQAATSSTDAAAMGSLFQWGRRADGHQCRTSSVTSVLSSSDQPGNGLFILSPNGDRDWRNPGNDNLWQGLNGINNPCPNGFRIPTNTELSLESSTWISNNSNGAFASPLKFTVGGFRDETNGVVQNLNTEGFYWTSAVNGSDAVLLDFYNGDAVMIRFVRAKGLSVRCIKDIPVTQGSINTLDCGAASTTGTLTSGVIAIGVTTSVPYTGGNGGTYNAQSVSSTGVTGLTANSSSGLLALGSGNLGFVINGTPIGSGIASFALNVGGVTCNLDIPVNLPVGTIASLDCAGAGNSGTLVAGIPAGAVGISVPYSGGNGGTFNGQTVSSSGVTGLTATLSSGTFANGSGSVNYTITGTPATSGTANFAISLGGQSCTISFPVNLPVGSISALTCSSAVNQGTLTAGVVASGVSSSVPYSGGNGGTHNGQTVSSSGVTGLTATLSSGTFANGSGSLIYAITGTPASSGQADFALNIGGQTCSLSIPVIAPVGVITALNCASAVNAGNLYVGVAATGATITVPYTGGNGGTHNGQTVNSTGISGLTATLSAGSFLNGSGNLVYNITGTAASTGMANFAFSIGGQTCNVSRSVTLPPASVSAINCGAATNLGTLTGGTAASGVSSSVPYTGGNGGSFSAQSVNSTGVTGLTATVAAGNLVNGNGSINYTISGTPSSGGTASFALSIGGQSCTLTRSVSFPPAAISSLNCAGAVFSGTLTSGTPASGVSLTLPYSGGNGGSYNGQSVSSTGITGLTATLSSGSLLVGGGNLVYTISGTPSGYGTATFPITFLGRSCSITRMVQPGGVQSCSGTPTVTFTYNGSQVTYGTVQGADNRCWLDRNLGASQVAVSSADAASYGDLFQWGRAADGHQLRNSAVSTTLSSSDQPSNGNYISISVTPFDWRSPQNNNLWQGVSGVNNPCPSGWRIPTSAELDAERAAWSQSNSQGAFSSPLRLPAAGTRSNTGGVSNAGAIGYYWSSTINTVNSQYLLNSSTQAYMASRSRSYGHSVRCIRN